MPTASHTPRRAIAQLFGVRAVADASGVIARFDAVTRVADATGTRFDDIDRAPDAAKKWAAIRQHDPAKGAP